MKRVETSSCKVYLTSGLTITIDAVNDAFVMGNKVTLEELAEHINIEIAMKRIVQFTVIHQMLVDVDDESNDVELQTVTHNYNIPYDKISWVLVERV